MDASTPARARGRRLLRILLLFAVGLPLLMGFGLSLLLGLESTRLWMLDQALTRASDSLPGELQLQEAAWPTLAEIRLGAFSWRVGADTLVALQQASVSIHLGDLMRRSLYLDELELEDLQFDLPALHRHLPADSGSSRQGSSASFLRPGSLPGLPSIGIGRVHINGGPLALDSSRVFNRFMLNASADLRASAIPRLLIEDMQAADASTGIALEIQQLVLEPETGTVNGTVSAILTPGRRLELVLSSPERDGFIASAHLLWDGMNIDADLTGTIDRVDGRAIGITTRGELALDDPGAVRAAGVPLPPMLELPPLRLATDALLRFNGEGENSLRLELLPNTRGLKLLCKARQADTGIHVDSLEIALDDLRASGSCSILDSRLLARVVARCDGSRWLQELWGIQTDPMRVTAVCSASGEMSHPALELELTGSSDFSALPLDQLLVQLSRAGENGSPWRASVELEALQHKLVSHLELASSDEGLSVGIDRLQLIESGGAAPRSKGGGRLSLPAGAGVHTTGLQIAGSWFTLDLAGALDASSKGRLHSGLALQRLPEALRQRFTFLEVPVPIPLWEAGTEPGAQLTLDLNPGGEGTRMEAAFQFALPGPARLGALLPPQLDTSSLGDIVASGTFYYPAMRLALEANASGWLDSLGCSGSMTGQGWQLDRLDLALPGIQVHAAGSGQADRLQVVAESRITDLTLGTRLIPALADWTPTLDFDLVAGSTVTQPEIDLSVSGSLAGPGMLVDTLLGNVQFAAGRFSADLALPAGLYHTALTVDSLSLELRSSPTAGNWFPLQVGNKVSGNSWSCDQHFEIRQEEGWVIGWNRLDLVGLSHSMHLESPALLFLPAAGGMQLPGLALSGEMGRVNAGFRLGAADPTLHVDAVISETALLSELGLPQALRPASIKVVLDASGDTRLNGSMGLQRLPLDGSGSVDLDVVIGGSTLKPRVDLLAISGLDTLLTGFAMLPFALSLDSLRLDPNPQQLSMRIGAEDFPLPLGTLLPTVFVRDESALLEGSIDVSGAVKDPRMDARMRLDFSPTRRLSAWEIALETRLEPGQRTGESELQASLEVRHASKVLATGRGQVPLTHDSTGALLQGQLKSSFKADSIDLALLNDWLPPYLWLLGRGGLRLDAQGPLANPQLDGSLRIRSMKLGHAAGTRLYAGSALVFAGTLDRPRVTGSLDLVNGRVIIPDLPRNLHPPQGTSRLWDLRPPEMSEPRRPPGPSWLDSLGLDVILRVPRPLRFEGRDLQLSASGELRLNMEAGLPRVIGEMEVSDGSFHLLSRSMSVRRGHLNFYGEETLDPELDLELGAMIDQSDIQIKLTGSFLQPRLEFQSDPPMSEAEILALLLFGRPTSELDVDQQDLLQRRATQVAAEYSMARLQAKLAKDLGLDLLRYQSDGVGGRSSLEMGKYIGPRVFVRYTQALDQQSLYRLQLDYILSRRLRLESSYGRQSQSGLQLNWIRTY